MSLPRVADRLQQLTASSHLCIKTSIEKAHTHRHLRQQFLSSLQNDSKLSQQLAPAAAAVFALVTRTLQLSSLTDRSFSKTSCFCSKTIRRRSFARTFMSPQQLFVATAARQLSPHLPIRELKFRTIERNMKVFTGATALLASSIAHVSSAGFVKTSGTAFELDGNPFYFLGTNSYWASEITWVRANECLLGRTQCQH